MDAPRVGWRRRHLSHLVCMSPLVPPARTYVYVAVVSAHLHTCQSDVRIASTGFDVQVQHGLMYGVLAIFVTCEVVH